MKCQAIGCDYPAQEVITSKSRCMPGPAFWYQCRPHADESALWLGDSFVSRRSLPQEGELTEDEISAGLLLAKELLRTHPADRRDAYTAIHAIIGLERDYKKACASIRVLEHNVQVERAQVRTLDETIRGMRLAAS